MDATNRAAGKADSAEAGPRAEADDGFEGSREAVLDAMLKAAPFEGWTPDSLRRAATAAGVDGAALAVCFPKGVADVFAYWSMTTDDAMIGRLSDPAFAQLRIRDKVAFAVRARLAILRPHKEAARRAAATLALPVFAPLGAQLAWKTADAIWRGLGDKATDFNFYSKRAILTGVWTATLARWLGDDSANERATDEFLERRIANIMQFEKFKAKARDSGFDAEGMFGWLAKLRYPQSASARAAQEARVDEALKETFPASDPPSWPGTRAGGAS